MECYKIVSIHTRSNLTSIYISSLLFSKQTFEKIWKKFGLVDYVLLQKSDSVYREDSAPHSTTTDKSAVHRSSNLSTTLSRHFHSSAASRLFAGSIKSRNFVPAAEGMTAADDPKTTEGGDKQSSRHTKNKNKVEV